MWFMVDPLCYDYIFVSEIAHSINQKYIWSHTQSIFFGAQKTGNVFYVGKKWILSKDVKVVHWKQT